MIKDRPFRISALLAAVLLVLVAVPQTAVAQVLPHPGDPPQPCDTVQCPNPCQDLGLCCSPLNCVEDVISDVEDLVWWLVNQVPPPPDCDPATDCVPDDRVVVPDPCSGQQAEDCIPDPGCSRSEPQPDLGDTAVPTEGSAEWSVGAVVTIPCHNYKVSTPAGPVGTDTGYMTDPYFFGWPVDNTCNQSPYGEFELQMKVGFKDAEYSGKLPFRLFRSQIQFDLPDKSKTFPKSKGGGEIGSDCSAQYAFEKDSLKQKGREWLNTRLESLEVPINGSIAYVPMADGSYLVNLAGGGEAVLQYALPTGSTFLDLGVLTQEQWRFEAAWTAESAAFYDVVVMGTGSSHQLSNLL